MEIEYRNCLMTALGSQIGVVVFFLMVVKIGFHARGIAMAIYTNTLKDNTISEIIPIALAYFLWHKHVRSIHIQLSCDNMVAVHILYSKSERVITLVQQIMLWSLKFDFQINAVHISGVNNKIVDSISRMQWKTFPMIAPEAGGTQHYFHSI
jgi:hypothetical protein